MSSFFRSWKKEARKSFLVNGSALLDEFVVSFKGKHNIPIRSFTGEELSQATNGFKNKFNHTASGAMYEGLFEKRPIVVLYQDDASIGTSETIHNIVITSQMSHHKNVLKLLGCCLEYKIPALIYENSGTKVLSVILNNKESGIGPLPDRGLSWKRRLKIAKDIAGVVVYLHTAFPTPIVHRDIQPAKIIIDEFGVAKLFDFSLCIALPPGESQVEASVSGHMGYIDPEYAVTGIVTTKIDTFCFGLLLLQLLTGRKVYCELLMEKGMTLVDCVESWFDNGKFYEIMDPRINVDDGGGDEQKQQVDALVSLAWKCSQDKGENRPEMIDVAKELRRI